MSGAADLGAVHPYPLEAFRSWMDVLDHPWLLGDFVWTAVDYIGEASIGWRGYFQDQRFYPWTLAFCGDMNIAPEPRDVHDPAAWEGQVLFSEPERAAFRALLDLGLKDSFRLFEQPERSYTWWDYRNLAFRRKMGLRIDHILLSNAAAARCTACTIDVEPRRREQPSDHAPVIATLD